MKLPPYPKYKSSGVEWLGEVPEHWKTPSLYIRYQVDLGKMLNETTTRGNHLHPYLRNVDVQWNHINVSDLPQIDIGPWEIARFTVGRGDLLVCEGGEVGRAALVQDDADGLGYQKALHRLRPLAAGEDPRFMFYTLYGAAQRGVFVAGGNPNTIAHLTGEKLRRYRFPAPPAFEQRAIADFLDRETAKTDTLIAKKRTLIERLNEKRTALISRTVTRGLMPDAARAAGIDPQPRLTPTGIEWLRDVPEHWEVKRLRQISDVITVGVVVNPSTYVAEVGVPFLMGGDVREFYIDTTKSKRCLADVSSGPLLKSRLAAGDLVVVRVGYPGIAAVVSEDLNGANCASMMIVRRHRRFVSQWLAYAFNSQPGRDQIDLVQYGAAQKQFNISHAVDFTFPFPPLSEQYAIAEFLDYETEKIDSLVETIETAIERLHEYRAALITETVTGKIDVTANTLVSESLAALPEIVTRPD